MPTFYEQRAIKKDGKEFDAEFNVSTYTLKGEIYSLAVIRDITERKRAGRNCAGTGIIWKNWSRSAPPNSRFSRDKTEAAYLKLRELEKLRMMDDGGTTSPLHWSGCTPIRCRWGTQHAIFRTLGLMRETSRALSGMVTSLR